MMAPEELALAVYQRPFVPFRITLTEGSTYDVRHPEMCMAGLRSAVIGVPASGHEQLLYQRTVTVDIQHIVKMEPLEIPMAASNGIAIK